MEGPRACKKEELESTIELINKTFRTSAGCSPTMADEYRMLLGERNLENIRIILEEDKPVADVNYYKSSVLIEGTPVKVASIGAVCTDESARGKGYASLILDDVEKRLAEEHVHLMLVSGTRSIYTRRDCCITGKCTNYVIYRSGEVFEGIELVEYSEQLLNEMLRLYNSQGTRFYRTAFEFENLLKGATTPWSDLQYKIFLIKANDGFKGYSILRMYPDNDKLSGYIVECAGEKAILLNAFQKMISLLQLEYMGINCSHSDIMADLPVSKKVQKTDVKLSGTIKLIDFPGLMNTLRPYFAQYVPEGIIQNIKFEVDNSKCVFILDKERVVVEKPQQVLDLILGSEDGCGIDMQNSPTIKAFCEKVFPIPFPWVGNINHQ